MDASDQISRIPIAVCIDSHTSIVDGLAGRLEQAEPVLRSPRVTICPGVMEERAKLQLAFHVLKPVEHAWRCRDLPILSCRAGSKSWLSTRAGHESYRSSCADSVMQK